MKKRNLIPKEAKRKANNHLAEGEHTGHYHAAIADDVQVWEHGGGLILDAPSGTEVTHQEHQGVLVPAGVWDRSIVKEFDHFEEESRDVQD